jgi:hypothetical protein
MKVSPLPYGSQTEDTIANFEPCRLQHDIDYNEGIGISSTLVDSVPMLIQRVNNDITAVQQIERIEGVIVRPFASSGISVHSSQKTYAFCGLG